jgi:alkylation response protein AidB-like acyl-CoA dehydrogenase
VTSFDSIRTEIESIFTSLPEGQDLGAFLESARRTELPFLPCAKDDPATLYLGCFTALETLGAHSVPLAVGLTMHLYMLCALATIPLLEEAQRVRRRCFLDFLAENRLIVANSGSDSVHRANNTRQSTTSAMRTAEGLLVNGQKTFVSLATVADLLIFTAELEGRSVSLYTTLKGNPSVQTEESPFGEQMEASGTRSVTIGELRLPEENLVTGDGGVEHAQAHQFQRAWFEALIPAVYLGAAGAALASARDFCRGACEPNGRRLAELDGFVAAFGEQLLELLATRAISQAISVAVAAASSGTQDIDGFHELAAAFKYTAMRRAQRVVDWSRGCIGTRAMHPDHLLYRLTSQVPHGVLHPECEAIAERRAGSIYLSGRRRI